jgi:ABC-2 type transport system ATP-binding protein
MTSAIEIRGIRKVFGRFPAVSDLSFSVPQGVIFGLLGPNGAGKTTTIRMIMGITVPDAGEIRIHGAPMDRETQNRIGYLPEERGLYRKMKVLDHLYFLADIKEVPRAKAKERIGTWLDKMELRPWLKKKVDELSKGMQQKLQFIATIVHDPEILILDEPFSGLDPINAALVKEYLLDFRQRGKTIIFSTHVLEQAEKMCDEICLLARSKKILEGTVTELKRRYTQGQIRLATSASLADVAQVPGVATVSGDGARGYVLSLSPGVDKRAVLRAALDRFPVDAFSQKEPDLEEIYLEAVRAAGMEETRPID